MYLGKKTKFIIGITVCTAVLALGAVFALAKTGVIHIKYLADSIGSTSIQMSLVNPDDKTHNFTFTSSTGSYTRSLTGAGTITLSGIPQGIYTLTPSDGSNIGLTANLSECKPSWSFNFNTSGPYIVSIVLCGGGNGNGSNGPMTYQMKFIGQVTSGGKPIPGVKIDIIRRVDGKADENLVAQFSSDSAPVDTAQNNYQSPLWTYTPNKDGTDVLTDIYVKFSASGYYTLIPALKLLNTGVIIATNLSSTDTVETVTKTIKPIDFTSGSPRYMIAGKVKDAFGLLDSVNIRVYNPTTNQDLIPTFASDNGNTWNNNNYWTKYGTYVYSSDPDSVRLSFSKSGYDSVDIPLIPSISGATTSQQIVNGDSGPYIQAILPDTNLKKTATPLYIQGSVVSNGNLLDGAIVTLSCPITPSAEQSACQSRRLNGQDWTAATSSGTIGKNIKGEDQNFQFSNLYDISQPEATFKSYRISASKTGYFFDANGNGVQDGDEVNDAGYRIIDANTVRTYNSQRIAIIELNMLPKIGTAAKITGYVYDAATKKPIAGAKVAIQIPENLLYLYSQTTDSDANGYYQINFSVVSAKDSQFQLRAFKTNYSDDANAIIKIKLYSGKTYASPQTDFYLNKCQ